MESGRVRRLIMVDPLKHDLNVFKHSSVGPPPAEMEPGVYRCDMGEPLLSQAELDQLHEQILRDMAPYGDRVRFIRKASVEASRDVEDESLDLVFIDAIHLYENVKEDIEAWLPKVKRTGIISGDDYDDKFAGVVAAVNERFSTAILKIDRSSRVWYVKKSGLLDQGTKAGKGGWDRWRGWLGRRGLARPGEPTR